MGEWELQCRRRQWHAIAVADGFDTRYLLNLRGCWFAVVVARAGGCSGCEEAGTENGANDDADSSLDARRQLIGECFLLHQRVTTGKQEEVRIEQLQEPRDHPEGIDAYADPADYAGVAQFGERSPTARYELSHQRVPARLRLRLGNPRADAADRRATKAEDTDLN